MNLKDIFGSYLGHLAGYVLAGADIVSKINPSLIPPQYGILVSVAGLVTIASHHGYQAGTAGIQAAVDAATKALTSAPVKIAAMLLLAVAIPIGLSACKTAPTATQQSQIVLAVDVASGVAIQQRDTDPAKWMARAVSYKAIATELKAVNDAGTATLATLAADLQPLVAKLPPADQLAASALVAALTPYLNQQTQSNPQVANIRATVDVILQAVIDSCDAYGA